jgi:hypothetical protein
MRCLHSFVVTGFSEQDGGSLSAMLTMIQHACIEEHRSYSGYCGMIVFNDDDSVANQQQHVINEMDRKKGMLMVICHQKCCNAWSGSLAKV